MENLIKIDPIAVKDKNDVVKALTLLEKIGIQIMTEKEKQKYLTNKNKTVNNNFMIQENDGGFRIQSHYIGWGISIDNLETQINNLLQNYPNIIEKLIEIQNTKTQLKNELKKLDSSLPPIHIKEIK